MVAFRVATQRLAFWIRSLQIIYYEHYGKQSQYVMNWYDEPQDWSIKSSGNKAICIEMSTKNPSDITDSTLGPVTRKFNKSGRKSSFKGKKRGN